MAALLHVSQISTGGSTVALANLLDATVDLELAHWRKVLAPAKDLNDEIEAV
jgi:hypothetical protein